MAHTNPLGHPDRFRSSARQQASDQLLPTLIEVASGGHPTDVAVRCTVKPATINRAHELCYSAAWFHDHDGHWLRGEGHDPRRLALSLRFDVERVTADGFKVRVRPAP